jgi:lysophospholipase L1-like esterase
MQTTWIPERSSMTFKQPTPLKVIAIGDSVIYGYGDPIGGGWVERLRRHWMSLDNGGHILYNLGVRGDGVTQVLHRLDHEYSVRGELRNKYPDLIIISVGVNDSARLGRPNGKQFTPEEDFQKKIETLLDVAQSLSNVVFVGMVPVDQTKMPFLDCLYYNHADQEHYKEITIESCRQRHIPYLDIFKQWQNQREDWIKARLSPDGLHPNTRGYQNLFETIINWQPIQQLEYLKKPCLISRRETSAAS